VFNILLQVLDDGHITDAQGRKISFKNTIIIMTSNAGAQNIISPKKLGFSSVTDAKADYKRMKEQVMEEVKRVFKPEFINRIDEIIVFHSLTKEDIKNIVHIMLASIEKRCRKQMNLILQIQESIIDFVADKGFDDKYGARPIRRAIQTHIEDALAEEILEGRIAAGDTVTIDYKENKIVMTPKKKRSKKTK
jgi:ATP-dependent Clp protease ATP-binding subunit ClpC